MTDEQPELTAWEDRCRDCDDTGVTIQTERRCACQPPLQVEQPSQWALELWRKAFASYYGPGYVIPERAALTIQRAFAEREAELVRHVEYLATLLTRAIGDITALLVMSSKEDAIERHTAEFVTAVNDADAALKSREAGHAQ